MALAVGERLGSYQIVSALGAGGMGEVYRATDTRLGREVAIKILPADVAADLDRLARFEREARAVAALNHPNIVTLHEVGSSDHGPYLVLEKIEGRPLRDLLRDGPVPLRLVLKLGAQIAEGLAKAHAAGIVHRDLKPDNVMVTTDGFAKILDFGLAKLVPLEADAGTLDAATTLARGTASGLVLGTVGYLSPEQAAGKPVDFRADQFALGALLYEMVTRDRPFRRATLLESLAATLSDSPEPMRASRPDVPAPLEWLVERCLEKDPSARYASTTDLARDLVSMRDRLSELAALPSSGSAAVVASRTRRWSAVAALVAALGAVGAGAYVLGQRSAVSSPPSFQALTFQRGVITGARFAPDGQTIYYSAAFGSEPSRIYTAHIEQSRSRLLDLPPGFLLGVSSKAELAVLLTTGRANYASSGTLARVPVVGGTPRPLVDYAFYGDWAPDGDRLAVVRADSRCEFPIGRPIARCGFIRVSPRGDRLAVTRGSEVEILDTAGAVVATTVMPSIFGLAWSPDGREVWFTGSENDSANDRALYAVDLGGTRRLIARAPGALAVYDVSPNGKDALIATGAGWLGVVSSPAGSDREQALELNGRTDLVGLSADGRLVLLSESRAVGRGAYLRSTDGKTTIPLGDYLARGLSPDGGWALVQRRGVPARLMLLSTGTEPTREIVLDPGLEVGVDTARWSRDGRRLFVWLRPTGGDISSERLYVLEGEGPLRAVTPPVPRSREQYLADRFAVSPNGEHVATLGETGDVVLLPVAGGDPPQRLVGERGRPIHWSADGRHLFLVAPEFMPARVYRRDLVTGQVSDWRTLSPPDVAGVMMVGRVLIAGDDQSVVYQYSRGLGELYLARGLR